MVDKENSSRGERDAMTNLNVIPWKTTMQKLFFRDTMNQRARLRQ